MTSAAHSLLWQTQRKKRAVGSMKIIHESDERNGLIHEDKLLRVNPVACVVSTSPTLEQLLQTL